MCCSATHAFPAISAVCPVRSPAIRLIRFRYTQRPSESEVPTKLNKKGRLKNPKESFQTAFFRRPRICF
ncbi:hypothetical protein HMPREF9120_01950 [Neisseria sp. oral taxon 020 str. F0370]|nr:hypothetical protein HMPREF9120_01950 [Neisseria sp. oral taxon 020 str. F0370]